MGGRQTGRGRVPAGAAALASALWLASCGGSPPESPSFVPPSPTPVPGATQVTGNERMAWAQAGDTAALDFRAYVDAQAVPLAGVACDGGAPDAECSAPLPPMSDGVHTIAISAVDRGSGLEGPLSESITVQKTTAGRTRVGAAGESRPGLVVGGMAVETIAVGLDLPVQIDTLPDGRVLVADGQARVRALQPDAAGDDGTLALDVADLLGAPGLGAPGLARHPAFAENRLVYVALLVPGERERYRLRIVRLREAGDRLGEPATIADVPLVRPEPAAGVAGEGPRIAFGPDDLLYALLPPGLHFFNEPSASEPVPALLRLRDDGGRPDAPLTGIDRHPVGFGWHPGTSDLWTAMPDEGTAVGVQARPVGASTPASIRLLPADAAGTLAVQQPDAVSLATLLHPAWADLASGPARLTAPVRADSVVAGLSGRIVDAAAAGGGVFYLVIADDGDSRTPAARLVRVRVSP